MSVTVKCDHCVWIDTVSKLRHLRAWYRVPCPLCGLGEIMDEAECRVAEELIALERAGLVAILRPDEVVPAGQVRGVLNTAREPMLEFFTAPPEAA